MFTLLHLGKCHYFLIHSAKRSGKWRGKKTKEYFIFFLLLHILSLCHFIYHHYKIFMHRFYYSVYRSKRFFPQFSQFVVFPLSFSLSLYLFLLFRCSIFRCDLCVVCVKYLRLRATSNLAPQRQCNIVAGCVRSRLALILMHFSLVCLCFACSFLLLSGFICLALFLSIALSCSLACSLDYAALRCLFLIPLSR